MTWTVDQALQPPNTIAQDLAAHEAKVGAQAHGLGTAAVKNVGSTASDVAAGDVVTLHEALANPHPTAQYMNWKGTVRKTTDYQLALTEAFFMVEMNVAVANNLTVPANATVAFPIGTLIHVRQFGVGQTTLVAGIGVVIHSAESLKLRKAFSHVTLEKIGIDEWVVYGDLEAL